MAITLGPGMASTAVHALRQLMAMISSCPDLVSEGVGSPMEDGVGAVIEGVERGNHAAAPDLDEAGAEISRELAGQLVTQIMPPKILTNFLKLCQLGFHLLSKIHLAKQ
jgi:hypothetical protein